MSRTTTTFAEVLRQLRTAASLSQEDLAERAGLSLRGISDLERGLRRAPHLSTVRMLADALALCPADRQAVGRGTTWTLSETEVLPELHPAPTAPDRADRSRAETR